jgi:hypothetical protein
MTLFTFCHAGLDPGAGFGWVVEVSGDPGQARDDDGTVR